MPEILQLGADVAEILFWIFLCWQLFPLISRIRRHLHHREQEREAWNHMARESIKAQRLVNESTERILMKVHLMKFNTDLLITELIKRDPELREVVLDYRRRNNITSEFEDGTLLHTSADRDDGTDERKPGPGSD